MDFLALTSKGIWKDSLNVTFDYRNVCKTFLHFIVIVVNFFILFILWHRWWAVANPGFSRGCHAMKVDLSVCLKSVHLFKRITEIHQFSGLLAKCLVLSEPCHYITVSHAYQWRLPWHWEWWPWWPWSDRRLRASCILMSLVCITHTYRGGVANLRRGAPAHDFSKVSHKLHEIEKIWISWSVRPHTPP